MIPAARAWTLALAAGLAVAAFAAPPAAAPSGGPVAPFEMDRWPIPSNMIDDCVQQELARHGLEPALPCTDEVFCRRAYIDLIGTLPDTMEALQFHRDRYSDKRARLIEQLLARPEFADYWAMRWADVLRIKAEFPINLWPNAAQAYSRWVHDAIADNVPYDKFARELLTASGSNFRAPQVNFYRAVQGREPSSIAEAVALTFMGTRLDKWPEARRAGLAAFFSRIAYKGTGEWKEEVICLDPKPTGDLKAMFPDGATGVIPFGTDPRSVFAVWLINPGNKWFTRAAVNRIWGWMLGRGVIHEVDDIREDNPPSNPALLACLEQQFVAQGYDLRKLLRLICNSRTYQQSCLPRRTSPAAEALFASYQVRRVDAEVLADALTSLLGSGEEYSSMIPEPFTYIPKDLRSISLPDGSISSPFLEMFGRPARDTGLDSERSGRPSDAQRLYLLNAGDVHRRLERSPRVRMLETYGRRNPDETAYGIYLTVLSRLPTPAEMKHVQDFRKASRGNPHRAAVDLVWALMNTKEFLYRH